MTLLETIKEHNYQQVRDLSGVVERVADFMVSEDLNIWAGREVLTVKDFDKWIDLNSSYSDRYKDLWNCRPINIPSTLSDLTWAHENISKEFLREREYERKAKLEAAREQNIKAAKDRIRKKRSKNFGAMAVHEELSKALSKFV